jgi:hypothetical protein
MTVNVTKPAINLREKLSELQNTVEYSQQQFWFEGDASETDFELLAGWKPLHVFDAGALQKEGSGDDYEVTFNGFTYTVSFNTAPGSGNDIGVIAVRA